MPRAMLGTVRLPSAAREMCSHRYQQFALSQSIFLFVCLAISYNAETFPVHLLTSHHITRKPERMHSTTSHHQVRFNASVRCPITIKSIEACTIILLGQKIHSSLNSLPHHIISSCSSSKPNAVTASPYAIAPCVVRVSSSSIRVT